MDAWTQEIEELHQFFEGWIGGSLPRSGEAFSPLEAALANGFTFVTIAGELLDRGAVVEGIRGAHGARPGLEIDIRDPRLLHSEGDLLTAAYQEWQEAGGERSERISTVLFRRRGDAPNGLEWVHVHETPFGEEPGD